MSAVLSVVMGIWIMSLIITYIWGSIFDSDICGYTFWIGLIILLILSIIDDKMKEKSDRKKFYRKTKDIFDSVGIKSFSAEGVRELEKRNREMILTPFQDKKINITFEQVIDSTSQFGICTYYQNHLFHSIECYSQSPSPKVSGVELFKFFINLNLEQYSVCENFIFGGEYKYSEELPKQLEAYIAYLTFLKECITNPVSIKKIKTIQRMDVEYFATEGDIQYVSKVSGGGANLAGAVVGGMIAGGVGAIVGGQDSVRTEIIEKDIRKIFLCYRQKGTVKTDEIDTLNFDFLISKFREWMPEKEYKYVLAKHNLTTPTMNERYSLSDSASAKQSYAELKELKELLDLGIISKDEFEYQKKQILG